MDAVQLNAVPCNGQTNEHHWVDWCLRQRANQRGTYEELGQRLSDTMRTLAEKMKEGSDAKDTPAAIQKVLRDLLGEVPATQHRDRRHLMRCNVKKNIQDAALIRSLSDRLDPAELRVLLSRTPFFRKVVREAIAEHWSTASLDRFSYAAAKTLVLRLLDSSVRPNPLQYGLSRILKQPGSVAVNLQSPTGSGKTFGVESVLMDSKRGQEHIIVFVPASIETLKQFIAATEQARIPFCIAEVDGTLVANTETLVFGGIKDPLPRSMGELHRRLRDRKEGRRGDSREVAQRDSRGRLTRRQRRHLARRQQGVHAVYPSVIVAAPWMRWVPKSLLDLVRDVEAFCDEKGKTCTVFLDDFMATDQDISRGIGIIETMASAQRVCCMSATSASLGPARALNAARAAQGLACFEDQVYDDNRGLGMRLARLGAAGGLESWSLLDHSFEAFQEGPRKSPYALATIPLSRTFRLLSRLLLGEVAARDFLLGQVAQETALSFDVFRRKVVELLGNLSPDARAKVLREVPPEAIETVQASLKEQRLVLDGRPRARAKERKALEPVLRGEATGSEEGSSKESSEEGSSKEESSKEESSEEGSSKEGRSWLKHLGRKVDSVKQTKQQQRLAQTRLLQTRGGDARDDTAPGDTGVCCDFRYEHLNPCFQSREGTVGEILEVGRLTGTSEYDQACLLQHARLTVDRDTAPSWTKKVLRHASTIDGTPDTMGYGVHLTTLNRVDLPSQRTTPMPGSDSEDSADTSSDEDVETKAAQKGKKTAASKKHKTTKKKKKKKNRKKSKTKGRSRGANARSDDESNGDGDGDAAGTGTVSVAALIQGAGRVGRAKQSGQSLVVSYVRADEAPGEGQFDLMFGPEFRHFQNRLLERACKEFLPTFSRARPVANEIATGIATEITTENATDAATKVSDVIDGAIAVANVITESLVVADAIPDSWDDSDDTDDSDDD